MDGNIKKKIKLIKENFPNLNDTQGYNILHGYDVYLQDFIIKGERIYGDNFTFDFIKENKGKSDKIVSHNMEKIVNGYYFNRKAKSDVSMNEVKGWLKKKGYWEKDINIDIPKKDFDSMDDETQKEIEENTKISLIQTAINDIKKEKEKENTTENTTENTIENTIENTKQKTMRKGKRKKAPRTLIEKFKQKWQDPSFRKKVMIGATIVVVAGIAAASVINMIATQGGDYNTISNATNLASDIYNLNVSDVSMPDWSSIGSGIDVHTNLNDAINDANTLISNNYMQIDHMEAVDSAGQIINLDGLSNTQINNILDNGDYGIRGSYNGEYMGWFDEDTIKNIISGGKSI
jgi:hypothetical protein